MMALSELFSCLCFRLDENICKLDYSNNVLSDCFPNVWQYERTLEELDITSARVNYLPPQLFYCHGLKVLLASNNNIESIPEAIGTLSFLQKLNICRNFLSNVPESLKYCKNLTYLDLSGNNLQKIPNAITCLISLQELLLNETCLEFLPANFGRLVNLRIIELRSNNLVSLPKSMQRLKNLIRLDIGCNDFTVLPEVVGEMKQLRELWFDYNQIQHFPFCLGKLKNLVHCEANGNYFKNLPEEVGDCRNLELLSVSKNNLKKLGCSVGMLKSLVTLKCENNVLTDLPESISMLESLEELDVSYNLLETLPNGIGLLRKLRYLFADKNNLRHIPDEICSCSSLSILSISRNKISELPTNLGHLHNLKVLNIVENNISSLPVTVLSLSNLKCLWISCNQSKPLIPLQYKDISKRSELTCFMLPQLNTKFEPILVHLPDEKSPIYATKQKLLKEMSVSTFMNRRICFDEHATILCSNKQEFIKKVSALNTNSNSNYLEQNNVQADSCMNPKLKVELTSAPHKIFLKRSPTPYRIELRSMSQLLQESQRIYNLAYKHKDDTKYAECCKMQNNDINETSNIYYKRELIQIKSNDKQKKTILSEEENLQGALETLSINDYRSDLDKVQNIMITSNSSQKEHCVIRHGADFKDSAKITLPNKFKALTSEIYHKNDIKKSSKKWIFGVHKNPRVLQVQVFWENGCDITVNFLPSKDGIYIVSTVPESSASKALLPNDKLLEVDGIDFTCISLDKAVHILNQPRHILNIMISRQNDKM